MAEESPGVKTREQFALQAQATPAQAAN